MIYTDGSQRNIITRDHDRYSSRSGQLVLSSEGDYVEVYNPYPNLDVREVRIKADSWVSPDVDVDIQVNINFFERDSLRNIN